jgi:hypothetical protein
MLVSIDFMSKSGVEIKDVSYPIETKRAPPRLEVISA